jgi:ABC-type transporter Mla subunit MlaD
LEAGLVDISGSKRLLKPFNEKLPESTLHNIYFNDKFFSSIPGGLVGLGIIGTFLGLAVGVSNFSPSDSSELIKTNINTLLKGVGTSFTTSIYGMFFSLLFTVIYQNIKNQVLRWTDDFYASVDNKYLATDAELEAFKASQQKFAIENTISDYFTIHEDGQELKPSNYFHELLKVSEDQKESLSNLATNISNQLDEVINEMLGKVESNFASIIEDKLVPILEQLRDEKNESAGDAIQKVINNLETAMKEMLEEFKNSISGDTKEEMKELATKLANVASSLDTLPQEIKTVSNNLNQDMSQLSNSIKDVVGKFFDEYEQGSIERQKIQAANNIEFEEILSKVSSNVNDIIRQQELNSDKFSEVVNQMNEMTEQNKSNIVLFKDILESSSDIYQKIDSSSQNMNKVSEILNSSSNSLSSNSDKLGANIQSFVESNSESIEMIRQLQIEVQERTESFLQNFSKMESGIENVFDQFNTGLNGYSSNLNAELSKTIKEYAEQTQKATGSIGTLAAQIRDSVDAFTDIKTTN